MEDAEDESDRPCRTRPGDDPGGENAQQERRQGVPAVGLEHTEEEPGTAGAGRFGTDREGAVTKRPPTPSGTWVMATARRNQRAGVQRSAGAETVRSNVTVMTAPCVRLGSV